MKKLIIIFAIVAVAVSGKAQTTWSFDNAHTSVKFGVSHLVISEVEGQFKKYSGKVVSKSDEFIDANIDFTIDVNSINTDNDMRDKHLKSDDFFNAEKFPNITFKSTSFKKVSGTKYLLEGDLTIRDVTKRVKLDVIYNGTVKDPYGNVKAGFKITGSVNRFDYNLKWNNLADAGPVVGKDIKLDIDVELKKQ
ncbi:MAG: YceI family protein [Bacteroidota bacterium]|nr:YceI family protein [Bacteroidota bacterium]